MTNCQRTQSSFPLGSGLEVQNTPQVLKSVKGPGNTFDLNPKGERTLPSFGKFSWDIYSAPRNFFFKYQGWVSNVNFDISIFWGE
jgi:hypothetical protein